MSKDIEYYKSIDSAKHTRIADDKRPDSDWGAGAGQVDRHIGTGSSSEQLRGAAQSDKDVSIHRGLQSISQPHSKSKSYHIDRPYTFFFRMC